MKATKVVAVSLVLACGLLLGGCAGGGQQTGGASETSQEAPVANTVPAPSKNATPEEILEAITADFEGTEQAIANNLTAAKTASGDSYESYVANKVAIANWYEATQKAADELFARTEENSKQYFNALAAKGEDGGSRELNDGMKAWYRTVYEDAFKGFYQAVYEDDYKELYEAYYDGVLDAAYDSVNYSELSDEYSAFYRQYSDGLKDLYRSYSDAQSDNYRMYSDVSGEFYKGNYDLSKVLPD